MSIRTSEGNYSCHESCGPFSVRVVSSPLLGGVETDLHFQVDHVLHCPHTLISSMHYSIV